MDWSSPLAGALGALVIGVAALSYRNKTKWPTMRKFASNVDVGIFAGGGLGGAGLYFAKLFPKQVDQMLWSAIGVALAGLAFLLLVELANWLREP